MVSYSKLILKDRPDIVWAFDDVNESSSISYPINFFTTSASTYSASINANATTVLNVPIIFGGRTAIALNSSSVAGISIPALNRFSELYSSKNYAIEFWLRCDNVPNTEITIMKKRNFNNIGLFLNENYLIYRYGNSSSYIEASYGLPELDEPTHIVLNYSNKGIQLIVNGVSITPNNSNSVSLEKDASHSINDYLDFYGNENFNIIIDSISIYPFILENNIAKKHYIYGLGKNINENVFFGMGGDYYNLSTSKTKKAYYAYWDFPDEWLLTRYDNLINTNDGITSINYSEPTLGSIDYLINKSSNAISFTSSAGPTKGSYIDITDTSYLLKDGNPFFIKIKFDGALPSSGSYQTIMSYGLTPYEDIINFNLKNNSGSYYLNILDTNTASSLSFYIPSITSSPTAYIGMKYDSQTIFYFALSGSSIQTASFTNYSGSVYGIDPFSDYFPPKSNSVLRIGSKNSYDENLTASNNAYPFYGTFNKFVVIKNNFSGSTFSDIDIYASPVYSVYYKTSENRFIVSSFGNANFILHGSKISENTSTGSAILSSNRFEFGYPDVISGSQVKMYATMYDYSNNVIKAKTQLSKINNLEWMNLINLNNKYILFDIDIYANDVAKYPPVVKYFKAETYSNSSSYTDIYDDGGQNIRVVNGASAQSYLPEFYETPSIFLTNTSGIRSNKNLIDLQFLSSSIGGIGFFIRFNNSGSSMKFLEIFSSSAASLSLFSASTNSSNGVAMSSTSASFYLNGTASPYLYDKYWQHVTITFNPKLSTSSADAFLIRFGNTNNSNFYIQNIYTLKSLIEQNEVNYLDYAFNGGSAAIVSSSTNPIINVKDNDEKKHSSSVTGIIYQPIDSQTKFITNVNSATDSSLSSYISSIVPNDDSAYIDGIKLQTGNRVLSLADNQVYEFLSTSLLTTVTTLNGEYVNVLNGMKYANANFIKTSGSFVRTDVLQKIVTYLATN